MEQPHHHLLIVEDNLSLQQMLCWEFLDMGYQVTACECCHSTIKAMGNTRFDIALIDYNLPDGCGADLVRALLKAQPGLPIVLSSGRIPHSFSEIRKITFAPKPITARGLNQLFEQLLTSDFPSNQSAANG